MRHVMVMNSKGGCGKSTLATNLASYFAGQDYKVALADYDPQRTSLDWLSVRPEDLPKIVPIDACEDVLRGVPRDTEILVIDAPARTHGAEMNAMAFKIASDIMIEVSHETQAELVRLLDDLVARGLLRLRPGLTTQETAQLIGDGARGVNQARPPIPAGGAMPCAAPSIPGSRRTRATRSSKKPSRSAAVGYDRSGRTMSANARLALSNPTSSRSTLARLTASRPAPMSSTSVMATCAASNSDRVRRGIGTAAPGRPCRSPAAGSPRLATAPWQ